MKIDPANLNHRDSHHLLVDTIVPRPIAWVSSVDKDGVFNLAPFSGYTLLSIKPATVGFMVSARRDGKKKDSLINIKSTKEFVINVVDETLAEAMNVTAVSYPSDVDEFKEAGLTPVKADLVKAPLVAESPIKLECRLTQILEFGEPPREGSFIIGEVVRAHVRDELYVDGEVQMSKLKAIARLGGDLYCHSKDIFEMQMPQYDL